MKGIPSHARPCGPSSQYWVWRSERRPWLEHIWSHYDEIIQDTIQSFIDHGYHHHNRSEQPTLMHTYRLRGIRRIAKMRPARKDTPTSRYNRYSDTPIWNGRLQNWWKLQLKQDVKMETIGPSWNLKSKYTYSAREQWSHLGQNPAMRSQSVLIMFTTSPVVFGAETSFSK